MWEQFDHTTFNQQSVVIKFARALLAQAPTERMSEAAVDAAIEAWFDCDDSNVNDHQARMRRAIIAATKEYS
ncbi:hypothetical protein [Paraburkholderia tropica]|uniref:hypothetical protein n=1 Tax=Paraburkholderia tropica TaxID=92647 RepID=UPI003D290106